MMKVLPFTAADKPLVTVPKIVRHKALPGDFPTPKAATGTIRSGSPLMRDALMHMDTDPSVVEIAASPNRVEYSSSPHLYAKAVRYEHIPAIRIKLASGRYVFVDVIPWSIQRAMRSLPARTERLRKVLQDEFGAGYSVLDERSLHIQPRHRNVTIMWRLGRHADDDARFEALAALHGSELPITISELRSRARHLPPPRFTVFDDDGSAVFGHELADVDRLFSAVMRLAMEGVVDADTSRPFSDETVLNWRSCPTGRPC